LLEIKKVCVIGLGYIGLPTASIMANSGLQVIGVDKKDSLIDLINNGVVSTEEPGLKNMVFSAVNSGMLKAKAKVEEADAFVIAVPTPILECSDNKRVDLSYVEAASQELAPFLRKGNLVILESTCPPGTTENIVKPILEGGGLRVGEDLYLAYCPERVMPGHAIFEMIHNNRVIGGIEAKSAKRAEALYRVFVEGEIVLTSAKTAEMVKLTENIFRDVNIALANEISMICEKVGINAWDVISLANMHPRVNIHFPGPGVGGHCISVDPWFIISQFKEESKIIATGRQINDRRPEYVFKVLKKYLADIPDPLVTIMGLTYKGNINDIRESPALKIINLMEAEKIKYNIYDPHVTSSSHKIKNLIEAFQESDCALVLTDHDEFKCLMPAEIAGWMRTRQVIDTRNCIDRALWEKHGFSYYLIGSGMNYYS
jgi:UDP-N-acetyl-D-mannosaminuronic acid dehydrogenase